ncbi:hypothetical protein D1007_15644 [Hordeum vulgare]|nr:hypothetical protein D1007_15644 [Hordeum vulgare]
MLQALGIPALSTLFAAKTVISPEKTLKHCRDDSEAEYHPNEDNTSEGESSDDSLVDETEALQSTPAASSNSKGYKKTSQKTSKKRSPAMPPGGVKPQPQMENKTSQPTEDDPQSKSTTEVVAEVLAKHTKKPRFLQHVGIHHIHARSSASNCEAELAAENRNLELQERVDTLTKLLKES